MLFRFSIPGLVRGRVRGPAWLMAPAVHELNAYQELDSGSMAKDPDLEIELDYQSAPPGETWISWPGKHRLARWTIQAQVSDPQTLRLKLSGNRASRFIIAKWIVEPALRLVAESKGALLTHAAALSDGQAAVLVAGAGGAGKTTWALNWIGAGHPYLSDDFSILEGETVRPYLTPLRLSARNLLVNPVLAKMGFSAKAEIVTRTVIRRALFSYARFSYKARPDSIPGLKIGEPVKLAGAVWIVGEGRRLKTGATAMENRVEKLSAEEMADRLTGCDREENHGFGPGLLEEFLNRKGRQTPDFWGRHRESLRTALTGKPCLLAPAHDLPPASALTSIAELLSFLSGRSSP